MQKMHRRTSDSYKFNISKHHQLFGDCWPTWQTKISATLTFTHHRTFSKFGNFAMLCERHAQSSGIFESTAHQRSILYSETIISKEVHTCLCKFGHWRQRFSLSTECDASTRDYINETGALSLFAHKINYCD